MTDWTEHRYAVIDVEGNGQQPPDFVELGVVPIEAGKSVSRSPGCAGRSGPLRRWRGVSTASGT